MQLSRRALFTAAGAVVLGLTGCAVGDPRVDSPTPRLTPSPSPTPKPAADIQQAVNLEDALAQRASSIAPVAGEHTALVTAVANAHSSHTVRLAETFGPVDTPPPSRPAPPGSLDEATPSWREALSRVAADHRSQALQSAGELCLTLCSAAAFSATLEPRVADLTITISDTPIDEFLPVSDTDAMSALVAQLHAARFVYQTALGAFQLSDDRRRPLVDREAALQTLRDAATRALVSRGVEPPAAKPAYQVERPADPSAAIALTAGVETRLLPFVGTAVAGVPADDDLHTSLVDAVIGTTQRLVAAGGALPQWPGW